jgi:Sec1 family
LIESYSEFKLGERNVTKHFNLLDAIRTKITEDNLYTISELEQDMCSSQSDDKSGVFNRIRVLIEDPKTKLEQKLRLVLVFCLRYEGDVLCHQLKEKLRNIGAEKELIVVNLVIDYAGKDTRKGDLFAKQDFLKKSKTLLNNVFMLEPE